MKKSILILTIGLFITLGSFAQVQLPIQYRVDKQSMSYPMSVMEDVFFSSPYYTKPINISFDGSELHMYYDNNNSFIKESVTEVSCNADFEEDIDVISRHFYVFNSNSADTLMFVVDFDLPYVQIVLPTKNSKGEKVGYTSYKKYVSIEELALN